MLCIALALLSGCSSDNSPKQPQAASTTLGSVESPSTSRLAETTTSTEPTTERATLECIAQLPLPLRVGQLVMTIMPAESIDASRDSIRDAQLGGVLIPRPNGRLDRRAVIEMRDQSFIPLFVSVDEEGGTVSRLTESVGPLPGASQIGASKSPTEAKALVSMHAAKVADLGFNMVFAPVVDVRSASGRGYITERSFSSDAQMVAAFGQAYVDGWLSAGITPVLKHFPGHGLADDTHAGPAVVPPLSELRTRDLIPYSKIASGRSDIGVMMSHVRVPGLTGGPSSLSASAYGLLRRDVGFDGVVITDSLNMGAISKLGNANPGVLAIAAGADIALILDMDQAKSAVELLRKAVGTDISESRVNESVRRIFAIKGVDACALARKV